MATKKLTKKQYEILNFIKDYQKKHHYSPSLAEIAEHFDVSTPTVHQHVQALRKKGYASVSKGEKRSIEPYEFGRSELATIPLMGLISAGGPIEAISNPEPIQVPKSMLSRTGRHYALEVSGRSMIEEGISDGDVVIVRDQPTVENGESAVAYLPDRNEVTLKKIYREGKRIRLQPANKEMEPFYEENVEVQGKVLGVIRKIR